MTEMDNPGRRDQVTDFLNEIPGEESPVELPGGGMPRLSSDKDGNAGALTGPACPRYRGHSGGGKPPPPMLHPMKHAGHLA